MKFVERRTAGRPSLRYLDSEGAGATLVMLHGVMRRAEDFAPLLDSMESRDDERSAGSLQRPCSSRKFNTVCIDPDTRVVALDQRGHGDSERASSYLVTDYVADAVAFVRAGLARPVVLYGHSLGAMVAAAVAGRLPGLVRGVILEDPPLHTMGRDIRGSAWQVQFTAMREIIVRGGTVREVTDALSDIQLPAAGGGFKRLGDLRDRASLEWVARCLARVDPAVLTPLIEGRWLEGYDVAQTLSHVRCPALLLRADPAAGGGMCDEDARTARDSMPACRVVDFPGSGHLLHWLLPGKVSALVNEFVSQSLTV